MFLVRLGEAYPRTITWAMVLVTIALAIAAALPSIWPQRVPFLHPITVDTDPENMLAADEPVRQFHNAMRAEFALYDMVVVGIVNETHPDGVFNVDTLGRIHQLTEFIRGLRWPDPADPARMAGVVDADFLAPGTVDTIEQAGLGAVSFSYLMATPPATREEALAVREKAKALPMLDGTLVSEDGRALALYVPLTSKDLSYGVSREILAATAGWAGTGDAIHITGLPVAEDTFGVQMFYQMAISAPLAMLVIFAALWWFFRHFLMILSPMIVAMVSAMVTMGLLVVTGNTIHIMSSMIPIFIMPIAVLDAVHILSEFFDRYPAIRDRRETIRQVMRTLFQPMLYTSLTTMAGFASLALTPIPPVQVFGLFIAIGVFIAWLLTMVFIPAFVMFIPERTLAGFGHPAGSDAGAPSTGMARWLRRVGTGVHRRARVVLAITVAVVGVAGYGIARITINDNPVKWFEAGHPIRVADTILNRHFGGTYMAYLALRPTAAEPALADYAIGFRSRLQDRRAAAVAADPAAAEAVYADLAALADTALADTALADIAATGGAKAAFLARLGTIVAQRLDAAEPAVWAIWDDAQLFLDSERQRDELFKRPEVLTYLAALQDALAKTGVVGKSNSVADIVKTVHRELFLGEAAQFRIPDSAPAVAQTLLTFQNSHRPYDLDHFVTPDYRQASIWVQMTSGDNVDMSRVVAAVAAFTAANPPPAGLAPAWFGLNYINVIWQEKMVSGMLESFLGSFLIVWVMMIVLFRSVVWGLASMIPLTVTIGLIYGVIGLIGKDYDMPVAVLSALSLGLAVDYAIHFLARARTAYAEFGSWAASVGPMFDEPARAIAKNAIILGVGFLPLLAAPLVPYQTVGLFIAAILVAAGIGTLLILPALITVLERRFFGRAEGTAPLPPTAPQADLQTNPQTQRI